MPAFMASSSYQKSSCLELPSRHVVVGSEETGPYRCVHTWKYTLGARQKKYGHHWIDRYLWLQSNLEPFYRQFLSRF